ncbi:MAG: DUF805 domain-containing protein [Phycisphaerae bacterium]|nr:DUF805 domain-containing protein [Phycisphaerae bacterium]
MPKHICEYCNCSFEVTEAELGGFFECPTCHEMCDAPLPPTERSVVTSVYSSGSLPRKESYNPEEQLEAHAHSSQQLSFNEGNRKAENVVSMPITEILFSFNGRIGRAKFWAVYLSTLALFAFFAGVFSVLEDTIGGIGIVVLIPFLWIMIATQVKRWHDLGSTGWMSLINLIPFIGGLLAIFCLGFIKGTPGNNRYGAAV